jgi:peptide/nickel transport system permease protein
LLPAVKGAPILFYLRRRFVHSIGVAFAVLTIVFIAGRILGDPVRIMVGVEASEERVQQVRDQLGLNDPLPVQYARFAVRAVRLDFGDSFWQKTPTLPLVIERLPATFRLTAAAFLLAAPLGILLGAAAALRPHTFLDRIINVLSLGGVSMVDFWMALMLIIVFAVPFDFFKTSGYGGFSYMALPVLTLCYSPLGRISQITRSAMLDEMNQPHITVARAKGLAEKRIVFVHALKNAAIPVVTISGDMLSSMLNGAILVETVFAWPGIGLLTLQALQRRDLPLVEATVFVVACMVIVVNLLVDLSYVYLNPRIRFQ